ncbi:hypothetical protein ABZY57_15810 [Streptomyces sp. NPDC006450]|uniref:hypothetical protein n=1 Tax=Streptomyces sp. NPDC006450 TaxID=3155458 RepID=UPI0033BE313D
MAHPERPGRIAHPVGVRPPTGSGASIDAPPATYGARAVRAGRRPGGGRAAAGGVTGGMADG